MIDKNSKSPIAQQAHALYKEIYDKHNNGIVWCELLVYILNNEIIVGGIIEKTLSKRHDRIGLFCVDFPNDKKIRVQDANDFYCGITVNNKFTIKYGSAADIIEETDLEQTYFYILQSIRDESSSKDMTFDDLKEIYPKESDINIIGRMFVYDLHIYHGSELMTILHNVGGQIKIFEPLKIGYTSLENKNHFEHMIFDNFHIEKISESSLPYFSVATYKQKQQQRITNKLNVLNQNEVHIYFYLDGGKTSYILYEFCKSADKLIRLENCFDDDDTQNYLAIFDKSRLDDLAFVDYCLANHPFAGRAEPKSLGCIAIYNCPLQTYLVGLDNSRFPMATERWLYSDKQIESYREMVKDLYRKYGDEYDPSKLPKKLPYKVFTAEEQYLSLKEWLDKNHPFYIEAKEQPAKANCTSLSELPKAYDMDNAEIRKLREDIKEKYNNIYQKIVDNNIIDIRWKSEFEFFKMIKKVYPEAIYQYHTKWLGLQSLDAYLPDLNIGIEYQGIQHYQPINFFGGEEGFIYRCSLDDRKRNLCKENNVTLIEWHYEEPISPSLLKKKITSIVVNHHI